MARAAQRPVGRGGAPASRDAAALGAFPRHVRRDGEAATAGRGARPGYCEQAGDRRRRGGSTVAALATAERLGRLPSMPYPAVLELEPVLLPPAGQLCGQPYWVPAGLHGQRVLVRRRLGSNQVELVSQAGA